MNVAVITLKIEIEPSMTDQNQYQSPNETSGGTPRPAWVKIGLWGIGSRGIANAFLWFSIVVGVGGFLAALWYPVAGVLGLMLLPALWYRACITWVDKHGAW